MKMFIPPFYVAELLANSGSRPNNAKRSTVGQHAFLLPFGFAHAWLLILGSMISIWGMIICLLTEVVALVIIFLLLKSGNNKPSAQED